MERYYYHWVYNREAALTESLGDIETGNLIEERVEEHVTRLKSEVE